MNLLPDIALGLLLLMWIGVGAIDLMWIYKKLKEWSK